MVTEFGTFRERFGIVVREAVVIGTVLWFARFRERQGRVGTMVQSGRAGRRRIGAVVAATALAGLLISGLPSMPPRAAADELPPPLAGEAPTNSVPDSIYMPPAERPAVPEPESAPRPEPGTPAADALAAAEAVDADAIHDVDEALKLDVVDGTESPSEAVILTGEDSVSLSEAAALEAVEKDAPTEVTPGQNVQA